MEEGRVSMWWTDWLFHYQYIFKKRNSAKQKKKFMNALITDLRALNKKITIQGDQIIVNDMDQADQIIVTYYENVRPQFGQVRLFDRKDRHQKTMMRFLFDLAAWLVCTIIVIYALLNGASWWIGIGLLVLLAWAVALRNGSWFAPSLICNTSSILAMLNLIEMADKRTAFVFVPSLMQARTLDLKKGQKLILFECVGANAPLCFKQEDGIHYVFAASEQDNDFVLSQKQIRAKTINQKNIEQIADLYRKGMLC